MVVENVASLVDKRKCDVLNIEIDFTQVLTNLGPWPSGKNRPVSAGSYTG